MDDEQPHPPAESSGRVVEYRRITPHGSDPDTERFGLSPSYGPLRAHFKKRKRWYGWYQRWLSRARIPESYDTYLTRIIRRALLVTLVTVGLLLVGGLGLGYGTAISIAMIPTGLTVSGLVGFGLGTMVLIGGILYPWHLARGRRDRIEKLLPHAVVFMHAISQIEENPGDIIGDVAEFEAIYGDLAAEFETIRKDVFVLNDDLLGALENAQTAVPSPALRDFLDDLSGIIESGGNIETFLAREVTNQLDAIQDDLDDFLQTLTTLAPLFVVAVSIGPITILVSLIALGMMGGGVLPLLFLTIYAIIPALVIGSVVVIDEMASAQRLPAPTAVDSGGDERSIDSSRTEILWFTQYLKQERRGALLARVHSPLSTMRDAPAYSMLVTTPVAIVVVLGGIYTGMLALESARFLQDPLRHTVGYAVIPIAIITVPLAWFHEKKESRERAFENRLPDALHSLASSNERGMSFDEAIELVARRFEGPIAAEFRKTHRDIQLGDDITQALTDLANRHAEPRVQMTLAVFRKIVGSSNELETSLRALADHLDVRLTMEQNRRSEMKTHAVVVSMGLLVYLLIIFILDTYLFAQIPESGGGAPAGFGLQFPIEIFDLIFVHSALILAIGNGMIMGKLTDDSLLSGLKYINLLMIVVVASFLLAQLL